MITLIRSLLPAITSAIGAVFGNIINVRGDKIKELELHQKAIKEEKYLKFLESLIMVLSNKQKGKSDDTVLSNLMKSTELIYIIGSPGVVKSMIELVELASDEIKDKNKKYSQEQLYANLIKEMRKDLGNDKNDDDFPDELKIWTFS